MIRGIPGGNEDTEETDVITVVINFLSILDKFVDV